MSHAEQDLEDSATPEEMAAELAYERDAEQAPTDPNAGSIFWHKMYTREQAANLATQRELQRVCVRLEEAEALVADADKCVTQLRAGEAHQMALANSYRLDAEQLRRELAECRARMADELTASLAVRHG